MEAKNNNSLKFTMLTASKNEEHDVRMAIEAMVNQHYPNKEIIFVDDSTDKTKEIIREYEDKNVRLFDGPRKGCCEARNIGMKNAVGDVIVFVNADANLAPDFLDKIHKHYENGADWVVVKSRAFNLDNFFARFMQKQADLDEGKDSYNPLTSEGYSVKREAALNAGMISGDYPFKFCRDYTLGQKLTKAGYKKVFDRTIIAPHKAPDNFKEYWDVRKTRGLFAAFQPYFMYGKSLPFLFIKFIIKDILFLLNFLIIIPAFYRVLRVSLKSENPIRDFFPFYWAYFIQEYSRVVGEWEGFARLVKFKG
ncbi:MAG: glycosyltransferase [Candidatus Wolfebacteria bacterium]|nr:glycosyltransferase [Candidatus Wolfebacteria bacterium]